MESRFLHHLAVCKSENQVRVPRQSRVAIEASPDLGLDEAAAAVDNRVECLRHIKVDLVVCMPDALPPPGYWCRERRGLV